MTHDIRKSGVPVLAYSECDAASPVPLSLIVRFNESRATASLLLQSALFINGHDDKQTFVLQYDADNLSPGQNSLGPATIPLPQWRLHQVSRHGNPQIRTLALTLKKACPVWCPPSAEVVTPKPDHEPPFHRLARLARATKLHILFDYNWLHRQHHDIFHRLVDRPEQLAGFPVWRHYSKQYRREDWSVFHAADDATTDDEAPVGEGPPVYVEGSKRPRCVTPTPSSPPPKRVLLSPYPAPSPTEKDSIATPSPRPQSAAPSPRFAPLAALTPDHPDSLTDLDASQQPASHPASSPARPLSHGQPNLHLAVEKAVASLLPRMLTTLLPRILTASSPSPAPSLQSIASHLSTAPPPPVLSALGVALGEHMTRRIEAEVQTLYHHTLSHANHLRNAADADFFEEREGERLAFEKVVEVKYAEFKEQIEACGETEVERVGWRVDELGSAVVERAKWVREEREDLRRERAELRRDKQELRADKEELRRDKEDLRRQTRELQESRVLQTTRPANKPQGRDVQGRRARSAPP